MNRRAVAAIARKDMRGITSNVQIWLPMLIIPVIFCIIMPLVLGIAIRSGDVKDLEDVEPLLSMVERMPDSSLKRAIDSLTTLSQRMAYLMFNHMFAPMFLIVPIMAASTISADSFVGEKERGTMESLLLAPVDIMSMFMGKVLAALVPTLVLSIASFVVYGLVANIACWKLFGGIFFPHVNWLPLMALVMPAASVLAIAINVLISAKTSTFQAAYQISAFLVFPVVGLMIAQVSGVMLMDTIAFTVLGAVLLALDWVLIRIIVSRLDRSHMFESQVK